MYNNIINCILWDYMSVAKASTTSESSLLLSRDDREAQKILDDQWAKISTYEDIIPRRKIPKLSLELLPRYCKEHGYGQVLKYLKSQRELGIVRDATDLAAEQLAKTHRTPTFRGPGTASFFAITLFKIGACLEISCSAAIRAQLAGIKEVNMLRAVNPEDDDRNHGFVLYGEGVDKALDQVRGGEDLLGTLEKIAHGRLLDRLLLRKVFPTSKIRECRPFVDYITERGITKIAAEGRRRLRGNNAENIQIAQLIFEKAHNLTPEVQHQVHPTISTGIKDIETHIAAMSPKTPKCADTLESRIPGSKWKRNPELWKVWVEETRSGRADEIRGYLLSYNIVCRQYTSGPSSIVMVNEPDFDELQKLSTYDRYLSDSLLVIDSVICRLFGSVQKSRVSGIEASYGFSKLICEYRS